MASATNTLASPRLKVVVEHNFLREFLMIPAAADLCRTEPSKFSLKELSDGRSHAMSCKARVCVLDE